MPSGSYIQADVLCPFYKYDDGRQKITCEGITGANAVTIFFSNKAKLHSHLTRCCCASYETCPMHDVLMAKYED